MNLWKTLGLLLVFVVLLLWVRKYEVGKTVDFESDRTVVELLGFKTADEITEVSVQGADGAFTLVRDPVDPAAARDGSAPTWKITQPIQSAGDNTAIESYVQALLTAKAQKAYGAKEAAELSDEESGLAAPTMLLTLKSAKGKTATMVFGNATANKTSYYAKPKDGERLLIFAQFFVEENIQNKKLGDLRDKTLVTFLPSDAKTISLKYPSRTIELAKEGEDWYLTGARKLKADTGAVESMLTSLTSARIEEFVQTNPSDLSAYGLAKPRIAISIGLGEKGQNGLLFGDAKAAEPDEMAMQPEQPEPDKMYVQRQGDNEVLLVPGTLYDTFLKNETDLRDKTLLAYSPEEVTRIEYTVGGKKVVFEKGQPTVATEQKPEQPASWQLREPVQLPADTQVADNLASGINLLRATGFHDEPGDLARYGLAQPQGRITITAGGKALPALLLGKKTADGANLYLKREDSPRVLEVRASLLDDLETDPNRLRNLLVMELDRTRFKQIAIQRKNGDMLVLEAVGDDDWKVTKPVEQEADSSRVAAVITALSQLRADAFVTAKAENLAQYGLDKPDLLATVALDDGTKETVYVAEDPAGGLGAYLKRRGQDAIYKSETGLILTDLRKTPQDFEPFEDPSMNFGGMPPM